MFFDEKTKAYIGKYVLVEMATQIWESWYSWPVLFFTRIKFCHHTYIGYYTYTQYFTLPQLSQIKRTQKSALLFYWSIKSKSTKCQNVSNGPSK